MHCSRSALPSVLARLFTARIAATVAAQIAAKVVAMVVAMVASRAAARLAAKNATLATLLVLATVICTPTAHAQGFEKYREHTEFDDYFRKYSKRFFGVGFDWHYFKAQAIAESNLNPRAQSAVGAKGLMQLMPRTFEEVSDKSSYIEGALMEPRWNIAAGIWYNKYQFDYWQKGRGLEERLKFMYGSYNTGRVNLRKAQREAINRGLNPRQWQSMQQALPAVTGRHSRETINYVERIFEIKEAIR